MARDISIVLVNVTILYQLMEEAIVWDQIVKYSHVMKDAVQVHNYKYISMYVAFPSHYGNFYLVNTTLLQGCKHLVPILKICTKHVASQWLLYWKILVSSIFGPVQQGRIQGGL